MLNFNKSYVDGVIYAAKELNVPASWVDTIFYKESTRNPRAKNPKSGAVGLFQAVPTTAADLGYTTAEILNMSEFEQAKLYVIYTKKNAVGHINTLGKLYMINFLPKYQNYDDNFIVPTKYYNNNESLDTNFDKMLSVKEIKDFVNNYKQSYFKEKKYSEIIQNRNIYDDGIMYFSFIFFIILFIIYLIYAGRK